MNRFIAATLAFCLAAFLVEAVVAGSPSFASIRLLRTGDSVGLPVSGGVPLPRAGVSDPGALRVLGADGNGVASHATPLARWPDGSLRWVLVDLVAPQDGDDLRLTWEDASVPGSESMATEEDGTIFVDTGLLRATVSRKAFDLMARAEVGGRTWWSGSMPGAGPYLVDDTGREYRASRDRDVEVVLEENNPLRATVRAAGWHVAEDGARCGKFVVRMHFYRDSSFVRVFHTFIVTESSRDRRYRDLGVRVPLPAPLHSYAFATEAPAEERAEPGATPRLVQYTDREYRYVGQETRKGERSAGWAYARTEAGSVAIIARDFWQQFPKEIGLREDALVYHLWPRHGREATVVTPETISGQNALHLWNVHEGQLLDFAYPQFYLDYFEALAETTRYVEMAAGYRMAAEIDALGVAKTHEFIVHFGSDETAEPEERVRAARRLSEYVNRPPVLAADPEWVAESRALGPIGPLDPRRFPEIEAFFDAGIETALTLQEALRGYGMFNYGDTHHAIDVRKPAVVPYRYWYNTHHNMPRWPWLLFARSGDPRYLDWGVANARHVMDVDHCHYTTPEASQREDFRLKKLVGGICDYKGLAHWSAGGRFGYNSVADALLHYYYFTGDRRGLDVARLHGQGLLENPPRRHSREAAAATTSLIALYEHTLEEPYLLELRKFIDGLLATQDEQGLFPSTTSWTPWLEHYVDLTGDPRARDALVRWADAILLEQSRYWSRFHSFHSLFASAYEQTGDTKYLRYGLGQLKQKAAATRVGPGFFGDWLDVDYMHVPSRISWNAVFIPRLLYSLRQAPEGLQPVFPARARARFQDAFESLLVGNQARDIEVTLDVQFDGSARPVGDKVELSFKGSAGRRVWSETVSLPNGANRLRHRVHIPRAAHDGGGVFRLSAEGTAFWASLPLGCPSADTFAEAYLVPPAGVALQNNSQAWLSPAAVGTWRVEVAAPRVVRLLDAAGEYEEHDLAGAQIWSLPTEAGLTVGLLFFGRFSPWGVLLPPAEGDTTPYFSVSLGKMPDAPALAAWTVTPELPDD